MSGAGHGECAVVLLRSILGGERIADNPAGPVVRAVERQGRPTGKPDVVSLSGTFGSNLVLEREDRGEPSMKPGLILLLAHLGEQAAQSAAVSVHVAVPPALPRPGAIIVGAVDQSNLEVSIEGGAPGAESQQKKRNG